MRTALGAACLWLLAGAIAVAPIDLAAAEPGSDLHLTYHSAIDDTDQPYRLFVPPRYDPARFWPLIVALHGTGGDQNTLFDGYDRDGAIKKAAAEHGVLLLSPFGRGVTEFKGIGENDIFCAMEDVARRYKVDPDRIYLTGHSMGGQGAAYLALHHPDLFAGAAPLSSDCSFPWLGRNAKAVPFLWVAGADDNEHYVRGLLLGIDRMFKYGATVKLEVLPGEKHRGPVKEFSRIFGWLLNHKRDPHPRSYAFAVETPQHGRAWWTSVERMAEPGRMGLVQAEATGKSAVSLSLKNIAELSFTPDPAIFDSERPLAVTVDGTPVATVMIPHGRELRLHGGPAQWQSEVRESRPVPLTGYRQRPVARAPAALDMVGTEKRLANWITDAVRAATRAEIALYSAVYYRGLPIPEGQVDIVDLIQCTRPFDEPLVTVELTGRELLAILDDNLPDKPRDRTLAIDRPGAGPIIQVSGMRYAFDLSKPRGARIVESSLDPERTYLVALEAQAVEYPTFRLGGLFRNLDYTPTSTHLTLALYGSAARTGIIQAGIEGRVRDVAATGASK